MQTPIWQLKNPINAVVFDCDGTLTTIEGIDELADKKNMGEQVQALTAEAMGTTGLNPDLYRQRINMVKPDKPALTALANAYFENRTIHAEEVIHIFKRLQKNVFIVSAGLNPAVTLFGEMLSLATENVFAIDVMFDQEGQYLDFDHTSPMTHFNGKREIISHLKKDSPEILFVGDGMNDITAIDIVRRFVGYGGSYYRHNIAEKCDFYIRTPSMASLLPLSLTNDEVALLDAAERLIYDKGMEDIRTDQVEMK